MEMHAQHVHISVQFLASLLHFIIASLCPDNQRCSDTNDGSFERRVVSAYNVYLYILCMIEPGNGMQFSLSVKHLNNMHLSAQSPQIQIQTTNMSDGLLMVAQRKGA